MKKQSHMICVFLQDFLWERIVFHWISSDLTWSHAQPKTISWAACQLAYITLRLLLICQSNLRLNLTRARLKPNTIFSHHLWTIKHVSQKYNATVSSLFMHDPVLRSLRHCRSLTQLISSSLLSADLNDFPIKADLMYRSICTQSLSRIDCSQMSLPRPGPGAVIQKSSALSGPNVMRPGCAHANKTECQHWLSAHHSQLCSSLWLNCGNPWKTFSKDVCLFFALFSISLFFLL